MLAADEHPPTSDWGHPRAIDNATCAECGCSVIARLGGIPGATCVSCEADERRMLASA